MATRKTTAFSKTDTLMERIAVFMNEDLSIGCRICEYLCSIGAVKMKEEDGKLIADVIETLRAHRDACVCFTACQTGANAPEHFTTEEILAHVRGALWRTKS